MVDSHRQRIDSFRKYIFQEILTAPRLCSRILLSRIITLGTSNDSEKIDAENHEPWEFNKKENFLRSLMLDDETNRFVRDYIFEDSVTTYKLIHHDAGFALKRIPSMCNTDILMIHNNSGVYGLTEHLFTSAVKFGGNTIDFVDDVSTINAIIRLGFEEYGRVKWDNSCAKTGWLKRNSSSSDILLYKLMGRTTQFY